MIECEICGEARPYTISAIEHMVDAHPDATRGMTFSDIANQFTTLRFAP